MSMQHFYKDIGEDWFNYADFYAKVVAEACSGSRFVEVGSWKGRSASFMGVEIANSGKSITLDCVDTWLGSSEHAYINCMLEKDKDWLYNLFIENIKPVKHIVKPVRLDSISASKLYADKSLDFVFIDAAHEYEHVYADITHWLPKIKNNGILAGHDYDAGNSISLAVDAFFKDKNTVVVMTECTSWMVKNT